MLEACCISRDSPTNSNWNSVGAVLNAQLLGIEHGGYVSYESGCQYFFPASPAGFVSLVPDVPDGFVGAAVDTITDSACFWPSDSM